MKQQLFGPAVALRRRILLVAAVGIVPVAIAAGIALAAYVQQVERATQAKSLEITRVAATAISVELQQQAMSLTSLTFAPLLDMGDLTRYRTLLERFSSEMPGWASVSLATPDRRVLIHTATPADAPQPEIFDVESFDEAARTHKPVIGPLLRRPDGTWGIAVRVPVLRGAELKYILTALLLPETMFEAIASQALPADWVMSVFDKQGSRVARSIDHDRFLGTPAAASLEALMRSGLPHGTGITRTLEGTEVFTAFVRLPEFGWSVAVGIPTASVTAAARDAFLVYGGGILGSILLALFVAAGAARGISGPIDALREAAEEMGKGRVPSVPDSNIRELAVLGRAMVDAARTRERIESERSAVVEQLRVAAEERKVLLDSERAARNEAVRMGRLKDDFLASLSHELRTPLNSILGWAQMMLHTKSGKIDAKLGLETIERNARAQAKLIEDLLDVSRIISGKVQLDLQSVQLAALVESAIEAVRPAAQEKELHLEEFLDTTAGPVIADPARLHQIIGNLLSNAIKFTPPGGRIEVTLRRARDGVEIEVADDGHGIDPEFLPHLFERFRQADASITRRHGGLGLGLSIAHDLAAMHGGSLRAESAGEDQGSRFTLHLPISGEERLSIGARGLRDFEPVDLSGLRVMVVDDEPDARDLARRVLEECGAEVFSAGSAAAALATIEEQRPDVLVSDIGMPETDGCSLLQQIRSLGPARGGQIPAIALTAFARPEDRARVLRAGFLVHVAKPVEPAELIATVASVSGRIQQLH